MLHNTNRCSYSYMIQCIRTRVQNIRILENGICFAKKIWLYMYTCICTHVVECLKMPFAQ